jgi:hypothetical protein
MWGGVGIEAPRALTGACFLAYTCRPMEVLMIRAWRYSTALLLLACNNGTDDKSTEETDAEDTEVEVIEREPIVGDFTCLTPSADYDAITWLTQSIDPLLVLPVTVDGQVNDFQDDEDPARGETTVSLWYDDNPSGTPDASAQTDNTEENLGELEIDALSCQPTAYLALRNPALEDAKPTYKAHQVYPPFDDFEAEFTTVSISTYLLIPSVLGISPDTAKSIVSGTAFDCTRQPETLSDIDDGKVENAWVKVKDMEGNEPPGVLVHYFIEGVDGPFPDRDLHATSENGIWTAINVPVGQHRVEMWGLVDGEEVILGSTTLTSVADSINIANIFAGYEGVKYPGSCLVVE